MRSDDLSRFESRLTGDEGSVARDEQKLQRDEVKLTQDDDFAAKLGQGPDMREAGNSPMALGMDFGMTPGNSGVLPGSDQGGPPGPAPVASDFRSQLAAASGGPPSGGPIALPNAIPPQQVDTSGMSSPGGMPTMNLSGGQGRLSPGQIDSRFSGGGDANVDLSAMSPAGSMPNLSQPQQSMQLSMPQPRFIAAHHDASMIPDTKGTIGQRFRNEADMGAGIQHEMTAQQRQNKIVGLTLQNQEYEQADELAKNKAEEDQRQARVAIRAAKRDKAIDDAANGKEDPNRIFNNADTGTKIALGIGAFFGGLIPGVRPLMDMLGGNIQRDIEAQRQDKHNKQWGVEQKRLAMGQDREDDQDHRSFELQNQAQKWALAEKQIKSLMLRTDDPILKARGEQALAATGARITGLKQEYDRLSYVRPQVVGGGSSTGKGFVVKLPDGRQVLAPNEKKFDELTTKSAQVTNIQSNISRALSLRKNANALELANPLSATHRQLAALQAETAQLVTVARGQGAMSKGDQAVADEAIGSMTGIMDNNNEVLRSTGARFGEQLSREADALGAEHVQTGYQVDANGRIQRDVALTGEADKPRPNMPKGKPVR